MTANTIAAPVGQSAENRPDDVAIVQTLLNRTGHFHLLVDRKCGPKTVAAIVDFQKKFLANPDGRVNPSGLTWHKLSGPLALALLPQASGRGYFTYSESNRQYGTARTIQTIMDVCQAIQGQDRGLVVGSGNSGLCFPETLAAFG